MKNTTVMLAQSACALVLCVLASCGGEMTTPPLFTKGATAPTATADDRAQPVQFDSVQFRDLRTGDRFSMPLPDSQDGALIVMKVTQRQVHLERVVSITAENDSASIRLVLSGIEQAFSGAITVGQTTWQIRSSATGSSLQNEAAAGFTPLPSHTAQAYQEEREGRAKNSADEATLASTQSTQSTQAPQLAKTATAATVATVDILFMSDTSYQRQLGSEALELADLAHIVTVANDAFAQSNAYVRLRMVGYERLSSDWTALTLSQLYADARNATGNFTGIWLPQIRSGADVVVGVSAYSPAKGSTCGLATVGLFNSGGLFATASPLGVAQIARSNPAVTGSYCSDTTLAHEIGHILGAEHDRANSSFAGAFSYSYGYGVAGKFGDIMSYLSPRLSYFSSPTLIKCAGLACGTPTDDTVRTFNETAPLVGTAMDADARLNGIYWDPNASGTGWTVDASNGNLVVGAFTYDDTGRATWYTGVASACATKPGVYCLALNEYEGGQTLTGLWQASRLKRKVVDVELTFSSGYPATLSLRMAGLTKSLQRFVFEPVAGLLTRPRSPGKPLPRTYWNPSAPGSGIFMDRQGDNIVATFFYYRLDGSATWSTTTGANYTYTSSTSYNINKMTFGSYKDGQTLLGAYRAPTVANANEASTYMQVDNGSLTVFTGAVTRQNEKWAPFAF